MKYLISFIIIIFLTACGNSFSNESKQDVKKFEINRNGTGGGGSGGGGATGSRPPGT